MKKLLIILGIVSLIAISYIIYNFKFIKEKNEIENIINSLNIEIKDTINLDKYYVYGNHLNLEGKLNNTSIKEIELYIHSKEDKNIPINYEVLDDYIKFKISNKVNDGLLLDQYKDVYYLIFLEITDNSGNTYYYSLNSKDEIDYYTTTDSENNNYKLEINSNNKYNTLSIKSGITKDETYDIIIDPGHGGTDSGACHNKKCDINERTFTPEIASRLKENLEAKGYKVAYTWDVDKITNKDVIPTYGANSRTARPYETHSKLLISIHLNSSSSKKGSGYEIYTPYNIDYSFAKSLSENLSKVSHVSTNKYYQVYNGIYTRTFSTYELNEIKKEREKDNLPLLDISTKTNYYYMIRETGGEITDAYVDGTTNKNKSVNPYRNNIVASESYIIELGYMNNANDIKDIKDNMNLYIDAIVNTITIKMQK